MAPLACINSLRDLPHRLQLPLELARELKGLTDRPTQDHEALELIEQLLATSERILGFIDGETARLTQQRFALADPNMVRQRMLAEPRRQLDLLVGQLKQKLAAAKQDWGQRIMKQVGEVATTIDGHVDSIRLAHTQAKHTVVVCPEAEWAAEFDAWKLEVYRRWADHLGPLLRAKTTQLVQPELDGIEDLVGEIIPPSLPAASPMNLPKFRDQPKRIEERFETPTPLETFFEMFKGHLSTVAMLAGMVVVPVIGSLMHEASTEIRAIIMGAAVAPILVFAFVQARGHRRRLAAQSLERARERIIKSVAAETKLELERFRPEAERHAGQYCALAQQTLTTTIDALASRVFEVREREAVGELAKAQLQSEQIQDSLNTLRQVKGVLTGQVLVELRRRREETLSNRGL